MSRQPIYRRISITLPAEVLAEADRLATDLDRPRSWVIAEAVRRFREPGIVTPVPGEAAVAGPSPLRRNLTLSPLERLREAQELVRISRLADPRSTPDRLIGFDRLEDYLTWKAIDRVGG